MATDLVLGAYLLAGAEQLPAQLQRCHVQRRRAFTVVTDLDIDDVRHHTDTHLCRVDSTAPA